MDPFLSPAWLGGSALAFGLVVGSFLNVVIHRLPLGESIVFPASRCPACGTGIRAWDNVPVVSYLILGGRCRHCRESISPRYPAVELVTGCLFAAIALHFGPVATTPLWMAFGAALLVAAAVDIDHQIIPDAVSLGGLGVGLVAMPVLRVLGGSPALDAAIYSASGAFLGGFFLWSVGFGHARFSVAIGREFEHWPGEGEELPTPGSADYWLWFPGLGLGDVKLLAMIGAFLGPWGVLQTIVAASLAGLAMGVVWVVAKRNFRVPFGFGPAIALGAIIVLFAPHLFLRLLQPA